jgi:hypothetical protein
MLSRRVARTSPCSPECPFWEAGGAVVAAGCALERILPEAEWLPQLAERWLRVRDAAGTASDWSPTSLFSILLG